MRQTGFQQTVMQHAAAKGERGNLPRIRLLTGKLRQPARQRIVKGPGALCGRSLPRQPLLPEGG
jgi:hypothetical protein